MQRADVVIALADALGRIPVRKWPRAERRLSDKLGGGNTNMPQLLHEAKALIALRQQRQPATWIYA